MFHALSGADVTRSFFKKGKLSFWVAFQNVNEDILNALAMFGCWRNFERRNPIIDWRVHLPSLQSKNKFEGSWRTEIVAFHSQAVWVWFATSYSVVTTTNNTIRAHLQAMEWNRCHQVHPRLPFPKDFGWTEKNNMWVPVMCINSPAPTEILELIKCGCTKSKCRNCKCASRKLRCSEMCACEGNPENCENWTEKLDVVHNDDDSDEDLDSSMF